MSKFNNWIGVITGVVSIISVVVAVTIYLVQLNNRVDQLEAQMHELKAARPAPIASSAPAKVRDPIAQKCADLAQAATDYAGKMDVYSQITAEAQMRTLGCGTVVRN
jgi:hypothetical protein